MNVKRWDRTEGRHGRRPRMWSKGIGKIGKTMDERRLTRAKLSSQWSADHVEHDNDWRGCLSLGMLVRLSSAGYL